MSLLQQQLDYKCNSDKKEVYPEQRMKARKDVEVYLH